MGWVSSLSTVSRSCLQYPRVSRITPSILTFSQLEVAPSFSTCGKKTSCQRPGRRLVMVSRGILQSCTKMKFPELLTEDTAVSENTKKECLGALDQTVFWRSVYIRELPLTFSCWGSGPQRQNIKVKNLSFICTSLY